jgi:glycosyltransferase involved in cell wall biosynthesis
MIPTYNCAKYLRQTLDSVMSQDPGPEQMQIEVVDDCSTGDNPEALIKEIGKGRIAFYRKPQNEGAIANFNTCIQRSRGYLLHILHGDDYVLPGFYSEILRLREIFPEASFLGCRNFGVDEDGVIGFVSPRIAELEQGGRSAAAFYYSTVLQFCGVVVCRMFLEKNGGFLPALVHTADCEMWTRAISQGGGIVSSKVLSAYRVFPANDTSKLMRAGENIRDLTRLNLILEERFPDFSPMRARLRAALMARSQARFFAKRQDSTASNQNATVWREVAPFSARVKETLKDHLRPWFRS